jgi:hypothetical protein
MPDIAGCRGVGCASSMGNQVALFAEDGASLHGLLANPASDSCRKSQNGTTGEEEGVGWGGVGKQQGEPLPNVVLTNACARGGKSSELGEVGDGESVNDRNAGPSRGDSAPRGEEGATLPVLECARPASERAMSRLTRRKKGMLSTGRNSCDKACVRPGLPKEKITPVTQRGHTHPDLSKRLFEPWVLEQLLGTRPVRRVLPEALHEEVAHLLAAHLRDRWQIVIHNSVHD